jgi:hypothetical protein
MNYRRAGVAMTGIVAVAVWAFVVTKSVTLTRHRPAENVDPVAPTETNLAISGVEKRPTEPRAAPPRPTSVPSPSPSSPSSEQMSPEALRHFQRLRSAPQLFAGSGAADHRVQELSRDFTEHFQKELPSELAGKLKMGRFDCFRSGCVVSVDYNSDPGTAQQFEAVMMGSDAFNRWPGPKMKIEKRPGDRASGAQWCFFRSSDEAVAMFGDS